MKITYIYHEYKNRRKRYADEMVKLGHDVSLVFVKDKKRAGQVHVKQIKQYKPDMLFLLSPFYIHNKVITDEAIEYAKVNRIPIVCYSTLNTQIPYTEMDDTWKKFDVFFAQNREMTWYLKSIGVDAHFVPLGFYPDQYPHTRATKTIDISFMGNPQTTVDAEHDMRAKYCKALQPFGIKVYGKGFNGRGVRAEAYKTHKDQVRVYAQSKINLDLPFINSSNIFYCDLFHVKNRFFEVPATGNFLLTAKCQEFTDILCEDMVGYYDPNIANLKETVKYYLENEELRDKMAYKAFRRVVDNHTFGHRFMEMFSILGM